MRERRALIADDHELFSWALQAILKSDFGFGHVRLVPSCDDALAVLKMDSEFDLICLDLIMPGMVGFESVRALRAASDPRTCMVVVTASTRRDDVADAIRSGVQGYIPKTLRTPEIKGAIRKVLQGQIFIPPMLMQATPPHNLERRFVDADPQQHPDRGSMAEFAGQIQHWSDLSGRQRAVGELILQGKSNKEIALSLGLAEGTVKVHVAALFRGIGARNRVEAANALNKMPFESK